MAATVTVTGVAGPAKTVTAAVFTGVSTFAINCESDILTMNISGAITQIAITAATTITATKSGSTYTLVIS